MSLHLVPVDFRTACGFVSTWHRHHRPPVGHKFSLGVADDGGVLRGVAMVGRPVARRFDNGFTLEVNRTATDGTPNANSMLYGAAWRAAKALGYSRLVTYTQEGESGSSLRASGFKGCGRAQSEQRVERAKPTKGKPRRRSHSPDTLGGVVTQPTERAAARETRPVVPVKTEVGK